MGFGRLRLEYDVMQNKWPSEIKRVALIAPALLGWVLGTGLQISQAALWSGLAYKTFMLLALMLIALLAINKIAFWLASGSGVLRWLVTLLCGLLLAFGLCGWRAVAFSDTVLDPNLEGRDIQVVGLVVAMPQRSETGLRFRLQVESARLDAALVAVPPLVDLAWYSGMLAFGTGGSATQLELQRQPGDLRAGERWQMTVRLKAPHGCGSRVCRLPAACVQAPKMWHHNACKTPGAIPLNGPDKRCAMRFIYMWRTGIWPVSSPRW